MALMAEREFCLAHDIISPGLKYNWFISAVWTVIWLILKQYFCMGERKFGLALNNIPPGWKMFGSVENYIYGWVKGSLVWHMIYHISVQLKTIILDGWKEVWFGWWRIHGGWSWTELWLATRPRKVIIMMIIIFMIINTLMMMMIGMMMRTTRPELLHDDNDDDIVIAGLPPAQASDMEEHYLTRYQ